MKKIRMSSLPTILESKDFQSVQIKVLFPFEEKTEDLAKIELLPKLLNYMNNKYPTEEEFQLAKKKLYILRTGCFENIMGTLGVFSFTLVIPDVKSLGKDLLEEQIKFFREIIYNPKVSNGRFDEFELEREKTNLKMGMKNALKNIYPYHSIKLRKLIDDEGILSRDLINNQELIDEVTEENLYEYYLKVIKNNQPVIYIMGDVDSKKIKNLCQKYLLEKKFKNKEFLGNIYYYLKPRENVLEIEEPSSFNDSILSIVYKIKDMKKEDIIYLNTIRDLLSSGSSRLLNEKLRDENDLIYSSRVNTYPHFGAFEITVFINKNNVSLAKEKIFDVMNDLKNEEITYKRLENIRNRKRINLKRQLDDKYSLFEEFILKDLDLDITANEYYNQFKKITSLDVCNFVDRMVLDTVYFLKEGENE